MVVLAGGRLDVAAGMPWPVVGLTVGLGVVAVDARGGLSGAPGRGSPDRSGRPVRVTGC